MDTAGYGGIWEIRGFPQPNLSPAWRRFVSGLKRRNTRPEGRHSQLGLRAWHLRHGRIPQRSLRDLHARALVVTGWHCLARPIELIGLMRAHLLWLDGHAVIRLQPAKKPAGHPRVPTLIAPGDGSGTDAYAALSDLEAADPIPASLRATTPLFSLGRPRNRSTRQQVSAAVRTIIRSSGETQPARQFAGRSLRVGGATELAARGASDLTIRLLGRWGSDAAHAYTRVSHAQALSLSATLGSAGQGLDPSLETAFPGYRQQ